MEEELTSKMADFMTAVDQVKKYRKLLGILPDSLIILGLTIVGFLVVAISSNLGLVFVSYMNPSWVPIGNTIQVILVLAGIFSAIFLINKKFSSIKFGEWKGILNEGAPGAIKLLQDFNWDNVYAEIRYAKIGFWFYGLLKITAYWLLTFVISSFIAGYLNYSINLAIIALFSLALVIALEEKDFKKRFEQVGRLDNLMWELRWFDNELRRSDFKA